MKNQRNSEPFSEVIPSSEYLQLPQKLTISEAKQRICRTDSERDLFEKAILNLEKQKKMSSSSKRGNKINSPLEYEKSELESVYDEFVKKKISNSEPFSELDFKNDLINELRKDLENTQNLLVISEQKQTKVLELFENQQKLLQRQQELTKDATDLNKLIQVEKNSLVLRLNQVEKFDWTWKFWLWFKKPSKSD